MEEKTDQERIHKAFEDARRWIAEAETPEMKRYRMGVVLDALTGKGPVNEEYDTSEQEEERNG